VTHSRILLYTRSPLSPLLRSPRASICSSWGRFLFSRVPVPSCVAFEGADGIHDRIARGFEMSFFFFPFFPPNDPSPNFCLCDMIFFFYSHQHSSPNSFTPFFPPPSSLVRSLLNRILGGFFFYKRFFRQTNLGLFSEPPSLGLFVFFRLLVWMRLSRSKLFRWNAPYPMPFGGLYRACPSFTSTFR